MAPSQSSSMPLVQSFDPELGRRGAAAIARRALADHLAIGVAAVDVDIAVVVATVVADFRRIRRNVDVEHERTLVRAALRIDGIAVYEHVVGARIKDALCFRIFDARAAEVEPRRPRATAIVVTAELRARLAAPCADVNGRVEARSNRVEVDGRGRRQNEVENGLARIPAAAAHLLADVAGRVALERAATRDELGRQTVRLLHLAKRVFDAVGVVAVDEQVVVVVLVIVADLGLGAQLGSKAQAE